MCRDVHGGTHHHYYSSSACGSRLAEEQTVSSQIVKKTVEEAPFFTGFRLTIITMFGSAFSYMGMISFGTVGALYGMGAGIVIPTILFAIGDNDTVYEDDGMDYYAQDTSHLHKPQVNNSRQNSIPHTRVENKSTVNDNKALEQRLDKLESNNMYVEYRQMKEEHNALQLAYDRENQELISDAEIVKG